VVAGPSPVRRQQRLDRLWLNAYTFSDFRFDGDRDWGDNRLRAPRHFCGPNCFPKPAGLHFGPNVSGCRRSTTSSVRAKTTLLGSAPAGTYEHICCL
jgi:hypothetical protein